MSATGRDVEALVAVGCGFALLVATAAGVAVRIVREFHQVEPAPYSVCECCGQVLDGTNNVCVPEGIAEGSSKNGRHHHRHRDAGNETAQPGD